ncbi:MAG: EAL domain-containing protein [Pseudomonadota bacterium]|nr:EAL domain-containing protein [Pseudomonadota bacterium]
MPTTKAAERWRGPHDRSRWIVGIVASCSIVIFAALGSKVIPAALGITPSENTFLTTPFLLSIALVILAWRRSAELKLASDARAEAEEQIRTLAYKDPGTGLYNRRFLADRLKESDSEHHHTLMLLDVDHFKKVNDLYGHPAGDELLVLLSVRMQQIAGEEAVCARLGGDEFAIYLSGDPARREEAIPVAERLLEAINRPFQLTGCVTVVSVSIGLATLEPRGGSADHLLRRGDIALYEAKRLGRNCCIWFDAAMEQKLNARNIVEAEMRTSLSEGRFVPYFQPMLQLSSGQVSGFEVLARWDHPTRGIVEPDDFIPVAEATGMISELSFAVMHKALIRATKWPSHVTLAVNISPVQFKDPLLAQRIIKLLTETGFPAARLELEITESAIMEDRDLAFCTVQSLKNYGIRISLDDFGTGYASLSQLRELPFDRIKIDKSFVASLMGDKQSNAIVHAIATLGRSLNLPITAEGVETESVHQRLQELGCSDAQGYLYGRPIPGLEADATFLDLPISSVIAGEATTVQQSQQRRDSHRRGAS